MPVVKKNGKTVHLPYTPAGMAKAAEMRAANKPATTGKPATPGSQRSATATARNKGQQGAAMRGQKANAIVDKALANPRIPQKARDAVAKIRSRGRRS